MQQEDFFYKRKATDELKTVRTATVGVSQYDEYECVYVR